MLFGKFVHAFAPLALVALIGATTGCDKANIKINGKEGKKLSELDLSGKAPEELALLGPDEVRVTLGAKLTISVEGDAAAKDKMRFTLDDGTLGILRDEEGWNGKPAIINVTMPTLREVAMLGSGRIVTPALARDAKVVVAGSGEIETATTSGDSLEVTIPGSGRFRITGDAKKLELTILGSGSAEMDALKVETAKVTIAGSGSASFASDGEVSATILGSGEVRVRGRARCKISAMGSGRLVCENGTATTDQEEETDTPSTPASPPTPATPPTPPTPKGN